MLSFVRSHAGRALSTGHRDELSCGHKLSRKSLHTYHVHARPSLAWVLTPCGQSAVQIGGIYVAK
eukprot:scaffold85037_cov31-Tisochrysis_lutea.AAC.1